jgi:Mrp family chromosome partitioning ATPase/predicted Fe-Mo cluster-binding NifX family protein
MSEVYESQSSCSSDCSSCQSDCSSRKPSKQDFEAPMNQYSNVKKVIGIVSGKGGVGKSLVTSFLSVLMNRKGYKTAILDADITGPSIPKAFGIHGKTGGTELGIMPALSKNGTKVMSINLLLDSEDTPVIWRGSIVSNVVKQFWSDVVWDDVDYMFVDMPPGTGDVPLTVFQSLPVDGIIIVASPQELVSMIVSKAVNMANSMDIPILGLVENYSYVQCGSCGEKIKVFGESHLDEIAEKYNLPVLANIPIDPAIAAAIDGEQIEILQMPWLNDAAKAIEEKLFVEKTGEEKSSEEIEMTNKKIAVTTDQMNNVFQHFGRSETFTIYEITEGKLSNKSIVKAGGEGHSELVVQLKDLKVDVLICGGIGMGAMEGLMGAGVLVVPGAQGDVDVVVASYLDGSLVASENPTCDHHHEHEDHHKQEGHHSH